MSAPAPIPVQIGAMAHHFDQFRATWRRGLVRWTGPITPSAIGDRYEVEVSYRLGTAPWVRVLSPTLTGRGDGRPIPHTYPRGRLCLYYPRRREWSPNMLIAETVVPWAALWLRFYEAWLVTGVWHGGGVHPTPRRRGRRGR